MRPLAAFQFVIVPVASGLTRHYATFTTIRRVNGDLVLGQNAHPRSGLRPGDGTCRACARGHG